MMENHCSFRDSAGSYYDPLPWSVCLYKPDYSTIMTNSYPICECNKGDEECRITQLNKRIERIRGNG